MSENVDVKLTDKQKAFLQSIREERDWWLECNISELRTATSLSKKGLVEIQEYPGITIRRQEFFECRLTDSGRNYVIGNSKNE